MIKRRAAVDFAGPDRTAAAEAFATYLDDTRFTVDQIRSCRSWSTSSPRT